MTLRTIIKCDGDWQETPCRGFLSVSPDSPVKERARDAGWSRNHGRDLCPAHTRQAAAEEATWTCEKQVTYATQKEARTGLNRVMRERAIYGRGPILKLEERFHWCSQHQGFHLTSKRHSGR